MLLNKNEEIKKNIEKYIIYADGASTHKAKSLDDIK
jgi:hypothetical protein